MKKLFQLLGHKAPAYPGLLGIEIEAEGKGMDIVDNKYWLTENDGSLRGEYPHEKAEFVLKKPIDPEHVVPALKLLVKDLPGAEFAFSYRCSVHVHVNVLELTHDQIMNMVYTYLLLEEPLMSYCGKSRKGNRFCLRLADAEGLLTIIQKMVHHGENSHVLANDNIRYSAINLASLNKYGSLEFRGMRGNLDIPVLTNWTRALLAIRTFATEQTNIKDILALMEKLGPRGFITTVLGQDLYEVFTYPRLEKDMARSYSISLDLPYAYRVKAAVGEVPRVYYNEGVPHRDIEEGSLLFYERRWYERKGGDWDPIGKDDERVVAYMAKKEAMMPPPQPVAWADIMAMHQNVAPVAPKPRKPRVVIPG